MDNIDLNLLFALDALLAESSVTGAARRLGLSTSAMSRTLKRLRAATGDPLLVRAGRGLVPTPYAGALQARVHDLVSGTQAVLSPPTERLDLATLARTFTIRANEGFVDLFSGPLVRAVTAAAPRVRLCFVPKADKRIEPLREGRIDLDVGIMEASPPQMRARALFQDRFVGAVRRGHPLLEAARPTPQDYAAWPHVVVSRRGRFSGPVDQALEALGLRRDVRIVVPGFSNALRMAGRSDLVALVPRSCLGNALVGDLADTWGVAAFDLPVDTPGFTIAAMWHSRVDADPSQRWLRGVVASLCRKAFAPAPVDRGRAGRQAKAPAPARKQSP